MIHVFGDSHAMIPWQKVYGVSYNWTKGTAFKFSEHKDFHINIYWKRVCFERKQKRKRSKLLSFVYMFSPNIFFKQQ